MWNFKVEKMNSNFFFFFFVKSNPPPPPPPQKKRFYLFIKFYGEETAVKVASKFYK